jgi:hypothetical protein
MSRRRRSRSVLVAPLLLLLAFGAGSASGSRVVRIGSEISIRTVDLRFSGRVTSPNDACAERRRVVLFKVVHGGPDEAMVRTRTDAQGAWSVRVSGFAGVSLTSFYAKARRSSEGTAGTIYVCSAARSKAIRPGA